ncbi:MAG TPA: hypothetical protein VGF75_06840 [Candidatus Saccharimonadales bacterium]|jgi:hypothetical protein
MGIRDIDFSSGEGASTSLAAAMFDIAVPVLAGMGAVGLVVVDLPEIVVIVLVIGIVLAILFASDLILRKSRNFLSNIWVVGSTLVKGLEDIYDWEYSKLAWIEDYAKKGFTTLANDVHHLGNLIFDVFFAPYKAIMDRYDAQQDALNTQVQAMQATFTAEFARDELQEAKDIAAINAAVNQFKTDTLKNFATVTASILQEVNDRVKAIAAVEAALQTEITDRKQDTQSLQNNINTLSQQLNVQIQGLVQTTSTLNATLTGVQTNESQLTSALGTLEGTVAQQGTQLQQEETTVAGIETTVAPITATNTATLSDLLALSGVALANLIDLANDPCLCLDPIGGSDALYALVAGLEVGIL